jgi:acyl-CoA hydrolase
MFKKMFGGFLAAGALALALVAPVSAGNQAGNSLVNVQVSDTTIAVPIALAANLCDIDVNVLARQADIGRTTCTATAESVATPGGGGGGNKAGDSLVNVQIDDLEVLLPIGVAANICDVNANVLAAQLDLGPTTCDAVANAEA